MATRTGIRSRDISLKEERLPPSHRRAVSDSSGAPEILLITSRGTKRWIIPKGNPIRGLDPEQTAAHEAIEEAGISGIACAALIGSYGYDKFRRDGSAKAARVAVFPLSVLSRFDDWPEAH